jgi:hypothetical protein
MIAQNWNSFGPIEGEEDLIVQIEENVKEAPAKLGETVWFGSKPYAAPTFRLKLLGED